MLYNKGMKKIYVEITNKCNLSCEFCIQNKRNSIFMNKNNFEIVLDKLKNTTKYLYLHVLGEPLLHPKINEFINLASKNYFVNITTNGYLIKRIIDNKKIRQINISLHSYNAKYNKSLNNYLQDIFDVTDKLKKYTYINYRIWVNSLYKDEIIKVLEQKYNKSIKEHTKLENNVYIDFDSCFIWPNINNTYYNEMGNCYALKDHLGILVDGTVVPCCLDSEGIINLGNIFKDDIKDIIKSDRYQNMLNGFKNKKKIEELCKHCNFLNR